MSMFRQAKREQRKARIALDGPSGAGKTYTALRAARVFGPRVAVIDTEHGSAELYEGEQPDGEPWVYDICPLTNYHPDNYRRAILDAAKGGYDVLIVDSLSHAWNGEGGALDMVDKSFEKLKFSAWRNVTPTFRAMIDAILACPCHVIVTMRTKTEYIVEEVDGKKKPRKIGTSPVMRDGIEYEFDVVGDMDADHVIRISKSRCSALQDRTAIKPGPDFWYPLATWLNTGVPRQLATPDQLDEIERLRTACNIPTEGLTKGIVQSWGVDEPRKLTTQQADQLKDRLTAKLATITTN